MLGVQSGVTNSELRVRVHSEGVQRAFNFPCDQTVWIGRDDTCDVVLHSQEVSRRHVSIFVKDGQLLVRDHSSYGTQVDGSALQRAVRPVHSPASLVLGPYRLELNWAGENLELRLREAAPWRLPRALALLPLLFAIGAAWLRHAAAPLETESAHAPQGTSCPAPQVQVDGAPTAERAVALLRAGDRVSALHVYRALAARDDGRAEYAIVASLLARELACTP